MPPPQVALLHAWARPWGLAFGPIGFSGLTQNVRHSLDHQEKALARTGISSCGAGAGVLSPELYYFRRVNETSFF